MGIPKRKTNISIYTEKVLTERRQELLDKITKSDVYLPDSILHDDLDKGFLEYVTKNFQVVSDGKKIPIIDKILTVQRWGEFTQTWTFTNDDGNIELPFVAIVRKPDVQPGTNPSVQRTIPDRHQFYYSSAYSYAGRVSLRLRTGKEKETICKSIWPFEHQENIHDLLVFHPE
jgi:hypothetical protein